MRSRHDDREGFYHTDGLGSTRLITDNVGLITDRYTYDAFGGLLDQTGTFGNSFGFAGEQRDAATGLDYLRARFYDSSLGRFISKDEFPGYLNDPYSQHDYQYADANPVRYTDPSGYFTLGDAMAAITLAGELATFSGIGFGAGYIAGAAATGASGEEILGMFGEWGAGFASGVSGGFLTDVYEYTTGQKIEPKHAMLYNAGNVTGIGVSFLTGMKAATWAKTAIGPLKWVSTDGENRLIGVNSGTSQQQYIYDTFGSRVASISDGVRTNYLAAPIWDLPQVLMEYDESGQITADYTHGIGLVRSRRDGREGFYHTDGLGSTRLITDNVGLISDRYTYDAFGGLLDQTGTFGNSFGFAGEQRDAATGLDYLRARHYDSSLGRFISKDEFPGYLNDPYSQHDYQYAHANPVRYTDPSGYFTLGDAMAAITLAGELATFSGIGFGAGYVAGAAASGASLAEIGGMFGEWGAGFASGVSGGFLTDVYEFTTGQKIEPKHAMLYNAGNVTGIGVSFLTGMKAATWAKTAMGPLKWVAAVNTGLDVYGAGKATNNLYQSYQDNGKFEREDAWNLLAYVPFVGAVLGVAKFFAANKVANAAAEGIDDALGAKNVGTTIKNCFVAGTEILTSEGIKNIEDIKVGDWVIADDPTTPGEIEAHQVTDTFVRETTALVDLYVDGEVISTTGEHPFWTPDKGWVEAKDLQVGSLLQTENGRVIDVDRVEKREGQFEVFNFSVEGFHTYFVSELDILVHNAEYFYRTMSEKEYAKLVNNGGLSIRSKGSSELGITRDSNYLDDLSTRTRIGKQYGVKVQFETNDGTFDGLINMGATHISAQKAYPHLPPFEKGMTVPQIKFEKNEVVSILLGESPAGVNFFNQNITNINRL